MKFLFNLTLSNVLLETNHSCVSPRDSKFQLNLTDLVVGCEGAFRFRATRNTFHSSANKLR